MSKLIADVKKGDTLYYAWLVNIGDNEECGTIKVIPIKVKSIGPPYYKFGWNGYSSETYRFLCFEENDAALDNDTLETNSEGAQGLFTTREKAQDYADHHVMFFDAIAKLVAVGNRIEAIED